MTPPTDDGRTAQRRSPLTGRAVILVLVVAALVVSSVVPMRSFFEQRAELNALRAHTAEQEQRVAALQAQKARWKDPAYVEAQARQRLHFTMAGEVGYVVLEPDEAPAAETTERRAAGPKQPWYATLLDSVALADEAGESASDDVPELDAGTDADADAEPDELAGDGADE